MEAKCKFYRILKTQYEPKTIADSSRPAKRGGLQNDFFPASSLRWKAVYWLFLSYSPMCLDASC